MPFHFGAAFVIARPATASGKQGDPPHIKAQSRQISFSLFGAVSHS
jgi:hypothetical protein